MTSPRSSRLPLHVVGRRVAPGVIGNDFTYFVVEDAAASRSAERRSHRRVRTHLREVDIREGGGRTRLACRIRDLSRQGARLELERERPLPRHFVLHDESQQASFAATLVWQTGRLAGVRLTVLDARRP